MDMAISSGRASKGCAGTVLGCPTASRSLIHTSAHAWTYAATTPNLCSCPIPNPTLLATSRPALLPDPQLIVPLQHGPTLCPLQLLDPAQEKPLWSNLDWGLSKSDALLTGEAVEQLVIKIHE